MIDKEIKDDMVFYLEYGKLMIFGKECDWGICLNGMILEVVEFGSGISEDDFVFYDEKVVDFNLVYFLSCLWYLEFFEFIGVFCVVDWFCYDDLINE